MGGKRRGDARDTRDTRAPTNVVVVAVVVVAVCGGWRWLIRRSGQTSTSSRHRSYTRSTRCSASWQRRHAGAGGLGADDAVDASIVVLAVVSSCCSNSAAAGCHSIMPQPPAPLPPLHSVVELVVVSDVVEASIGGGGCAWERTKRRECMMVANVSR